MVSKEFKQQQKDVSLIIDSLISMITNKDALIETTEYYYHNNARYSFLYAIYIFKLIINNNEYLTEKYHEYLETIKEKTNNNSDIKEIDLKKVTNIEAANVIELLINVRELIITKGYIIKDNKVYIEDQYIDVMWLTEMISLILDMKKTETTKKKITICYTIPNKDIKKIDDEQDLDKLFSQFTYYYIKVKYTDTTKPIKENNILIIKNAAINYLKHLKQFKHGLETEESYLIFYNLLKNECHKQGFILEEETYKLSELDDKYLSKVKEYITPSFYSFSLSKQIHSIENRVWQLSNDLTMLEHMNSALDATMNYINLLYKKTKGATYNKLKWTYNLRDIPILLVLIIQKFTNTYLLSNEEIDYSLLDLTGIKPEYMNSIGDTEEQDIKSNIKGLEVELMSYKATLDNYKEQKKALNLEELGQDRYLKELEIIVGNINRTSIEISRINSTIAGISREYEETKKRISSKYHNAELFNYNNSIIQHICNSITSCSFYLKTNNSLDLLENIIIFEDYKRADNAFYLEISFRNLLKISNTKKITGIEEQTDLPKLAGD